MNEETMKLYKITLRGMTFAVTGVAEGISYVIAPDPYAAYMKVKNRLDSQDIGFEKDRELEKIELLADNQECNNIGTLLYL